MRYAERALALCERLRPRRPARPGAVLPRQRPAGPGRPRRPRRHRARDRPRRRRGAAWRRGCACYVNAAGSAYRAGRFADAERYVAAGLRLAADGEFAAGRYRLHLTSAAVSASEGDWDRAVAELRGLVTGPGEPGVMALLARSLLARLLARRGDPAGGAVLAEALRDPGRGRQLRRRPARGRAGGGRLAHRDARRGAVDRAARRGAGRAVRAHRDARRAVRVPAPGRARRRPARRMPRARGRRRWPDDGRRGRRVGGARRALRAGGRAGLAGRRRRGPRGRPGHPGRPRRDADRPRA